MDCPVDGEPFQLSGCEPNVCTAMTAAGLRELGYTAAHPDAVTAGGLGAIDCFAATHVLEQADTAPSASCREAHGIFALSGCALRAACSSTVDTDIQCAEGFQYNASAATDLCSGAVCDISTAEGVDAEICCEVDPCFGCSCSVEQAPSPLPPPPPPSVMPVIVCDDPAMVHSDVGQCECAVSYYNTSSQILHCFEDDIEPAVNAARRSCELCPPCATCAGGQALPLLKDDWVEPKKSSSSVALPQRDDVPRHRLAFQCDPQRGCSGAHRDSAGCDNGHTGAMCQSCEEQYFLDGTYDCVSCEARQSSRTIVLAILLLVVFALAFAAISYRRKVQRGWDLVPGAQEDEDTQLSAPLQTMQWFGRTLCVRLVLRAAIQPLRIVFSHFQLLALLSSVLRASWPDQLLGMMGQVRDIFQMWRFLTECGDVDDFEKAYLARVVIWPSILAAAVAVGYTVERAVSEKMIALDHAKRNLELVLFIVYPSITYAAFSSLHCRTLQLDPVRQVLVDDDRVLCNDIGVFQAASLAVIIGFGCGAPAYLLWSLFQKKRENKALFEDEATKHSQVALRVAEKYSLVPAEAELVVYDVSLSRGVSILVDAYGFRHLFTEPLEMLRKLLLISVAVLLGRGSGLWQLVLGLLSTFAFFALFLAVRPFRLWHDNALRILCEAHMFIFLLGGLIYQIPAADDDRLTALDSSIVAWTLMFFLVALVPVAFMAAMFSKLELLCHLHDSADQTGDGQGGQEETRQQFQRAIVGLASGREMLALQNLVADIRIELGWDLSSADLRTLSWIREPVSSA